MAGGWIGVRGAIFPKHYLHMSKPTPGIAGTRCAACQYGMANELSYGAGDSSMSDASGRSSVNVLPHSSVLSTAIVPPCPVTTSRAMYRPILSPL